MTTALTLDQVDGIAVVTIDLPGEPVNKVTAGLRAEFAVMFDRIAAESSIRGVVLASGKADTWIAGADIDEFLTLRTPADAEALSRSGQVLSAGLGGSSGHSALDAETLAMVRRAQPFPAFPADVKQGSMSFAAPVAFYIR